VFQLLIVALVLSRLNYCNSVLFGLPANLIQRLRSVQNAAARLIFRIRRSEHITPALISLHWLCVPERIYFKLAVMKYRSIYGTSSSYLQSCFTRVSDMTSRRRLRSSTAHRLDVPPVRLSTVGGGRFRFLGPPSGMTCLSMSHLRRHSSFSDNDSRPFVFPFLPRHYHMTRVLLSPFITTVWTHVVLAIINFKFVRDDDDDTLSDLLALVLPYSRISAVCSQLKRSEMLEHGLNLTAVLYQVHRSQEQVQV